MSDSLAPNSLPPKRRVLSARRVDLRLAEAAIGGAGVAQAVKQGAGAAVEKLLQVV